MAARYSNSIPYLLTLGFLASLASCPQHWHVTVTDKSDPSHPELCLSRWPRCIGAPPFLSDFAVFRSDSSGRPIEVVWHLNPQSGAPKFKRIRYGEVPHGWTEVVPARPLSLGQTYCLTHYCLRFERRGEAIEAFVFEPGLDPANG